MFRIHHRVTRSLGRLTLAAAFVVVAAGCANRLIEAHSPEIEQGLQAYEVAAYQFLLDMADAHEACVAAGSGDAEPCRTRTYEANKQQFYNHWDARLASLETVARTLDHAGVCAKAASAVVRFVDNVGEDVAERIEAMELEESKSCTEIQVSSVRSIHNNIGRTHRDNPIDRATAEFLRRDVAQSVHIALTLEQMKKSASGGI